MIFTGQDWQRLAQLFDSGYEGYRPAVREVPNGDGVVDTGKRFLHLALKYNPPAWAVGYLARAHFEACRIAEAIGVPAEFYPRVSSGCLRVLEYPAGEGGAEHTDSDLFTVNCYRNVPNPGLAATEMLWAGDTSFHFGELAEIVGVGKADPHHVDPLPVAQHSIVYFALPDHRAELPEPNTCEYHARQTVGEWLHERMARSRTEGYK